MKYPTGLRYLIGPPVVIAMLLYAVVSLGGVLGAATAMNESADYEQRWSELENLDKEYQTKAVEESGSEREKFVRRGFTPLMIISEKFALAGYFVGYRAPLLAKLNGEAAPFVMIGMTAWSVIQYLEPVLEVIR